MEQPEVLLNCQQNARRWQASEQIADLVVAAVELPQAQLADLQPPFHTRDCCHREKTLGQHNSRSPHVLAPETALHRRRNPYLTVT